MYFFLMCMHVNFRKLEDEISKNFNKFNKISRQNYINKSPKGVQKEEEPLVS